MTRTDLLTAAAADLDVAIDHVLRAFVDMWRRDPAMTEPPTDPTGPWRRSTVPEATAVMQQRLAGWREQALRDLDARVRDVIPDTEVPPLDPDGESPSTSTVH